MGNTIHSPDFIASFNALERRVRHLESPVGLTSTGTVLAGGYKRVTANQIVTAGSWVLVPNLSATVVLQANRQIRYSWWMLVNSTLANAWVDLQIQEGATAKFASEITLGAAAVTPRSSVHTGFVVLTPLGGTHTYDLYIQFQAGGTNNLAATPLSPAQVLVEDIGST